LAVTEAITEQSKNFNFFQQGEPGRPGRNGDRGIPGLPVWKSP